MSRPATRGVSFSTVAFIVIILVVSAWFNQAAAYSNYHQMAKPVAEAMP